MSEETPRPPEEDAPPPRRPPLFFSDLALDRVRRESGETPSPPSPPPAAPASASGKGGESELWAPPRATTRITRRAVEARSSSLAAAVKEKDEEEEEDGEAGEEYVPEYAQDIGFDFEEDEEETNYYERDTRRVARRGSSSSSRATRKVEHRPDRHTGTLEHQSGFRHPMNEDDRSTSLLAERPGLPPSSTEGGEEGDDPTLLDLAPAPARGGREEPQSIDLDLDVPDPTSYLPRAERTAAKEREEGDDPTLLDVAPPPSSVDATEILDAAELADLMAMPEDSDDFGVEGVLPVADRSMPRRSGAEKTLGEDDGLVDIMSWTAGAEERGEEGQEEAGAARSGDSGGWLEESGGSWGAGYDIPDAPDEMRGSGYFPAVPGEQIRRRDGDEALLGAEGEFQDLFDITDSDEPPETAPATQAAKRATAYDISSSLLAGEGEFAPEEQMASARSAVPRPSASGVAPAPAEVDAPAAVKTAGEDVEAEDTAFPAPGIPPRREGPSTKDILSAVTAGEEMPEDNESIASIEDLRKSRGAAMPPEDGSSLDPRPTGLPQMPQSAVFQEGQILPSADSGLQDLLAAEAEGKPGEGFDAGGKLPGLSPEAPVSEVHDLARGAIDLHDLLDEDADAAFRESGEGEPAPAKKRSASPAELSADVEGVDLDALIGSLKGGDDDEIEPSAVDIARLTEDDGTEAASAPSSDDLARLLAEPLDDEPHDAPEARIPGSQVDALLDAMIGDAPSAGAEGAGQPASFLTRFLPRGSFFRRVGLAASAILLLLGQRIDRLIGWKENWHVYLYLAAAIIFTICSAIWIGAGLDSPVMIR